MLFEVPPRSRRHLRPLFDGLPGWPAVVAAALEGSMGRVYADDVRAPSFAVIRLPFNDCFIGGEPSPRALEALAGLLPGYAYLIASGQWRAGILDAFRGRAAVKRRVTFAAFRYDESALQRLRDGVPPGYALVRVDGPNFEACARFSQALVANYVTRDAFLSQAAGFGVTHGERFVAGASSYAIGDGKLEFEVQTHPDFRRRGLAAAASSALIGYCRENGLEPCWDAANEASAALALKLGFVGPRTYEAFELQG